MFAQLLYNYKHHISIVTHCLPRLGVQKDQNKTVSELLVQNGLKQDDGHGYRLDLFCQLSMYKDSSF